MERRTEAFLIFGDVVPASAACIGKKRIHTTRDSADTAIILQDGNGGISSRTYLYKYPFRLPRRLS